MIIGDKHNYLILIFITFILSGCQKTVKPTSYKPAPIKEKSIPTKIKTVAVTGAASELLQITNADYNELVNDINEDGWLLLDTYASGKKQENKVIQRFNIKNNQRYILSPKNSNNVGAVWSLDNQSFVFSSNRTSQYQLCKSMGINGAVGVSFITSGATGTSNYPNLNKNHDDVLFSLNGNIAMIKENGTQLRMYGAGMYPKYSPEGDKVLFVRRVGDKKHIFYMNSDGSSLAQITAENSNDHYAVWSPSGKKIAFISDRLGKNHLFLMNSDGSGITQLTQGDYSVSSVFWHTDGYIYFSANALGKADIWRLKAK